MAWWCAAALVLTASIWLSWAQEPWPDPFVPRPGLTNLAWWRYPVERNAFARLPKVTGTLQDVSSPDGIHVWCVGDGGSIVHSPDGGRTWTRQASGTLRSLTSVHFFNETRGLVVGDQGTALETTSGGKSWQPLRSLQEREDLGPLHFLDDRRGWIPVFDGFLWTENGGGSWTRRGSTISPVYFRTDRRRGWKVDSKGSIWTTEDEGRTWTPLYSHDKVKDKGSRITDIKFIDSSHGWAWGTRGLFLRTTNEGQTWERVPTGINIQIDRVDFAGLSRGWAVADDGTILKTSDGGRSWRPVIAGLHSELTSMSFTDASHGWVAGKRGTILATRDGGRTWEAQSSGGRKDLLAIDFVDPDHGWAAGWGDTYITATGFNGELVATKDGGRTWSPQHIDPRWGIVSIDFMDRDHGWIFGSARLGGMFVGLSFLSATSSGGSEWGRNLLRVPGFYFHHAIDMADNTTGWAAGESLIRTTDGKTWQEGPKPPVRVNDISPVRAPDGWQLWGVGLHGTVMKLTPSGKAWEILPSPTDRDLNSVHFQDPRRGWIVGDRGALFATNDGGKTWRSGDVPAQAAQAGLVKIQFIDGSRGWIAGANGPLLRTEDGGQTWRASHYRRWPAPWFYLACLISFLLLVPALRQPVADSEEPDSVDGLLISDRPRRGDDPDPLEFRPVALGISRFLRNESTQPPVTFAITGAWGTGKSSLMSLIRDDLADRGFCPIWFNAWHHQQEESLLAALLQAVQAQAIPRWWRPEAWIFRANLLRLRGWRHWVPLLVASAVFAFSLSFMTRSDAGETVPRVVGELKNLVKLVTQADGDSSPGETSAALLLVGSLIALFRGFWNIATAFGSKPADLLASAARGARIRDLEAQTTFRHRFASEFSEVTQALAPRRLTIFIDDLDRCQPQNVLQVLETVNFLVSSGDCFIVLGLAREQVEAAVGLGFKEVAAEVVRLSERKESLPLERPEKAGKEEREAELERLKRVEFARQYLAKLINLEVPVPSPSLKQRRSLLLGEGKDEPRDSVVASILAEARIFLAPLGALLVLLAVIAGSGWLGRWLSVGPQAESVSAVATNPQETPIPQPPSKPRSPSQAQPPSAREDNNEKRSESPTFDEPPARPAELLPADPPSRRALAVILPSVLVLLAAAAWVLTRRPDVVVRDSPAFKKALELWHPVISEACPTPRALKRFLNRVRYLAMRQRVGEDEPALWRVLARKIGVRLKLVAPSPPPPAPPIPEDGLVALAALDVLDPHLLATNSAPSFSELENRFSHLSEDFLRIEEEWWEENGEASFESFRRKFREISSEVRAS